MAWAFIQSAIDMADPEYGFATIGGIGSTFVIGIGSLALGLVAMFVWSLSPESKPFFRRETINKDSKILAPE